MEKQNVQNGVSQRHGPGQVGFMDILERVKLQVEADCFLPRDKEQVHELCCIIAEMQLLPETAPVQIGGVKMCAGTVAEIYSILTAEHLQLVIDEFRKISYKINRKKSYLRTMLYNSLFEYSSAATNEVAINNTG